MAPKRTLRGPTGGRKLRLRTPGIPPQKLRGIAAIGELMKMFWVCFGWDFASGIFSTNILKKIIHVINYVLCIC